MICALRSQSGEILSIRGFYSSNTSQLMTIIDLHLHTYKNMPNEISGKSKPVRLIDAMNITIDLPIEFCMTHGVRLIFVCSIRERFNRSRTLLTSSDLCSASAVDVVMWNLADIILRMLPRSTNPSFGEGSLTKLSSVFSIKPSETRNSVPHDVLVNKGKGSVGHCWERRTTEYHVTSSPREAHLQRKRQAGQRRHSLVDNCDDR